MTFLVLGMTTDFLLYPGHLEYYIMGLWILFNLFIFLSRLSCWCIAQGSRGCVCLTSCWPCWHYSGKSEMLNADSWAKISPIPLVLLKAGHHTAPLHCLWMDVSVCPLPVPSCHQKGGKEELNPTTWLLQSVSGDSPGDTWREVGRDGNAFYHLIRPGWSQVEVEAHLPCSHSRGGSEYGIAPILYHFAQSHWCWVRWRLSSPLSSNLKRAE